MADLFDLANLITTVGVDSVKIKTEPGIPEKSSNDILSELFSTFEQVDDTVSEESERECASGSNVKVENTEITKHKKSKKKHKHKDKKQKKKSKKKSSDSESNVEDGAKKSKKHKKKSKRRRDSASSKLDDADVRKSKVRKVDNIDSPEDNVDLGGNHDNETGDLNFNHVHIVKKEPASPKKSTLDVPNSDAPSDAVSRLVPKEILGDDLDDMVIPRLLDTSKQTVPAKILIKDLKNSQVYNNVLKEVEDKAKAAAARMEDGEISDSSGNRTPTLSPSPDRIDELVRSSSPPKHYSGSEKAHREDLRMILKEKELKKRLEKTNKARLKAIKDQREDKSGKNCSQRGRSRDRNRSKSKTRSKAHRSRSNGKVKSRDTSWEKRDKDRSSERDRWDRERSHERRKSIRESESRYHSKSRDRSWDRYVSRGRSRSRERKERIEIDKKKLLEIARKNAISMIQQGTLPLAQQDRAIAAIQAGGKTVNELTDFCKSLSKSEALGELSSISSDEDGSGSEKGFHHPFLVKDRPNAIIMNIRDAKQLPTKTFQEKTAESSNQLRLQFPVSSGQQHRTTENEWVPVAPKKPEPKKQFVPANIPPSQPLSIMPAPVSVPVPPVNQIPVFAPKIQQIPVFGMPSATENVDVGSIVSQRLAAMRKLRENPHDMQALNEMYRAQTEMKTWAESKQMPGQFTGSTGVKVLSPAELSAGYQAWARKDQLLTAQPVSGGMGMALLQKMGWKPGEGLGKNKEGTLVPLQLEVKLDKRGLVSDQDIGQRPGKMAKPVVPTVKTLEGKHPVSLLGEYCSKRKFGAPVYELCFECGPDHRKNFLFKVKVNGIEYKPSVASPNKKQAKAEAAQICLQSLGLLAT